MYTEIICDHSSVRECAGCARSVPFEHDSQYITAKSSSTVGSRTLALSPADHIAMDVSLTTLLLFAVALCQLATVQLTLGDEFAEGRQAAVDHDASRSARYKYEIKTFDVRVSYRRYADACCVLFCSEILLSKVYTCYLCERHAQRTHLRYI